MVTTSVESTSCIGTFCSLLTGKRFCSWNDTTILTNLNPENSTSWHHIWGGSPPPSSPPSNKWEILQIPWHIQCLWNTIVYSSSGNLKPDSLVANICIRDGCSIREMQLDPPRLIEPCGQRGYLFLTRECRLCVDCKRKLVFTMRI